MTSFNENEAQNFGLDAHPEHGKRYERASEFIDVVTGLWGQLGARSGYPGQEDRKVF